MQPDPHVPFDFDAWADLARRDAEAFERLRRETVEALISDAPRQVQERLRRLQWRVDAERRRYHHPLKSCVMLFNMMWDSVYGEHGLLRALDGLASGAPAGARGASGPTARILAFPG